LTKTHTHNTKKNPHAQRQQEEFKPVAEALYQSAACRPDGHCAFAYEHDIVEFEARPFDRAVPGCAALPRGTRLMGYDGIAPGPTQIQPAGHEAVVRFNNKLNGTFFATGMEPCVGGASGRTGRPTSVHFHGSASLATYDGWAEDTSCDGESKDYVIPNSRRKEPSSVVCLCLGVCVCVWFVYVCIVCVARAVCSAQRACAQKCDRQTTPSPLTKQQKQHNTCITRQPRPAGTTTTRCTSRPRTRTTAWRACTSSATRPYTAASENLGTWSTWRSAR
jgi:hypothetical protein